MKSKEAVWLFKVLILGLEIAFTWPISSNAVIVAEIFVPNKSVSGMVIVMGGSVMPLPENAILLPP